MQEFKRCRRIFFLMLIALFIFNVYVLRLAQIQILWSKSLTVMAVEQRGEKLLLGSGRGHIYDRNGLCLLDSHTREAVVVFPSLMEGRGEDLAALYPRIPGIEKLPEVTEGPARPVIIARDAGGYEGDLPRGIALTEIHTRYGPGSLAPHVVGYLKGAGGSGAAGMERYFDEELSPSRPPSLVAVVDARRRLVEGLGYRFWSDRSITSPYNIHLTLDKNIQERVEEIMRRNVRKGAAVVMDPRTGDLLAMASLPDFHQSSLRELFLETKESEKLQEGHPLLNRSVRSYFPGSTFKTVVAAAYLESGHYDRDFTYYCPGHINVDGRLIRCVRPHGLVDMAEALAQSCNGAFIQMGLDMGGYTLLQYARAMGFGERTSLPLEGERQGNLPRADLDRGVLALASMGQGDVDVTPLQLARAYSAVAAGGYLPEPRLVDRITTPFGLTVKRFPYSRGEKIMEWETAAILKDMLHGVMVRGTGRPGASPLYRAAAKTGTAETGRTLEGKKELIYWIAGFAPLENPAYTVVVFVEEALGKATPATIFKEIMGSGLKVE